MPSLLERLSQRQLLVVTGKGGVGKTVVSALLGRLVAATGRRVLLLEVDPRANLHELTGTAPSEGDVVTVGSRLLLQNLQARQVMEHVVRDHLRVEMLVKRVVASPIFRHFVDAAPGLKELAVLGHAWRTLNGYGAESRLDIDLVVLDAPATGHALSLLASPNVVSSVIREGPFGHMAGELAAFIGDTARTAILTVTLAEEMPVHEALELRAGLEERVGRTPELLVVNGLYPPASSNRGPAGAAVELWRRRRAINERELSRLATAWSGPRALLPLVPVGRGPALVERLAPLLGDALGVGEAS